MVITPILIVNKKHKIITFYRALKSFAVGRAELFNMHKEPLRVAFARN